MSHKLTANNVKLQQQIMSQVTKDRVTCCSSSVQL